LTRYFVAVSTVDNPVSTVDNTVSIVGKRDVRGDRPSEATLSESNVRVVIFFRHILCV